MRRIGNESVRGLRVVSNNGSESAVVEEEQGAGSYRVPVRLPKEDPGKSRLWLRARLAVIHHTLWVV